MLYATKWYQLKIPLLLNIKKHEKHLICVMFLVMHRGITLILFSRSAIQPVCLFDVYLFVPFHLMAYNLLYLRNVSVT